MKGLIFIFSMPRSGSTLLQRMLMAQPQIHSVSEPWLLLPLAYMSKGMTGVHTPYNHENAQDAIADLIASFPRKMDDYHDEIARFANSIYQKTCPDKDVYFLDKTPRYFLIIPFIEKIFPDAKFIFLFRNPLSTFASIINTWGEGRLGNLYQNHIDLYQGPGYLAEGWRHVRHKSIRISYEMLVTQPEEVLHALSEYLGITFNTSELLCSGKKGLEGKMGDKPGINLYQNVSASTLKKWKTSFNSRFRIWLASRYLKRIGPDVLAESGYPLSELLTSLKDVPHEPSIGIRDMIDFMRMKLYMFLTSEWTRKAFRKVLIPGLLMWKFREHKKINNSDSSNT